MGGIEDWGHDHPWAWTAYTCGICLLIGWQLDAPWIGAAVGVVWGAVTYFSWTRGFAHKRYLERHPPPDSPAN